MDAKPLLRSCGEQNLCCYMTAPLVWNLQMWKIHSLDHKKLLVLGSFHKKKPEKTHTLAILFNTANIVTRHDFKSRDFSKTLQLPCQNELNVGSNCMSRDGDTLLNELATLPPRKLPQKWNIKTAISFWWWSHWQLHSQAIVNTHQIYPGGVFFRPHCWHCGFEIYGNQGYRYRNMKIYGPPEQFWTFAASSWEIYMAPFWDIC